MSIGTELRQLFARWSEIARTAVTDEDTRRSVQFYLAEMADEDTMAGPRIVKWVENVQVLHHYVRVNGWPHRSVRPDGSDVTRQRLVNWVREQRRRPGALCTYQRERLLAIPGYTWAPLDDAWDNKVDDYTRFVASRGWRPSRRSVDKRERSLATWAANQRTRNRQGRLPKHRVDDLIKIDVWRW